MNRKAIRTALISRVDISDNFSNAHTFDVDVLEQSPNLADHLNDLINSADKEKTLAIARRIQESILKGVDNVSEDILDTFDEPSF
jgi:hypothetical protein